MFIKKIKEIIKKHQINKLLKNMSEHDRVLYITIEDLEEIIKEDSMLKCCCSKDKVKIFDEIITKEKNILDKLKENGHNMTIEEIKEIFKSIL